MKLKNLILEESRKKISRLLCVTALSTCSLFAYAQQQPVRLTGSNIPLKSVFKQIEKQTKLFIDYKSQDIDDSRVIRNMPEKGTVQEVLVKLLDGTDCVATYTNGHIIIRKQTSGTSPERKSHVTGTIVDATGEPVIGANVVVKGTANGTITDIDGNFSLEVPEGSVLLVSYIGYANQEVKVGKQTKLSIALREASEALDEVVVVGYTKQKKGLLTGAVVNMSVSEDLEKLPTTSAGNLLVGKIAGVNVSTPTAIPGKNPDISIRTGSSWNSQGVLYVIDGMVRGGGDFNNLSPSEIEDITILKDAASAAIYGSRSEGGVVLVTTKKGKIGKPTFSYSYGYSFDSRTKNQEFTSAVETFELYNRINGASPNADFWSQDELDYLKTINGGWGYDHLGQAYRNPTTQTHNLTVSGGTEAINYFAAASYVKQEGMFEPLNYDKYNLRVNVTAKISDDLEAFVGFGLSNNKTTSIHEEYGTPDQTYQSLISDNPAFPDFTDSGALLARGGTWNIMSRMNGADGYLKETFLKPQLVASLTYKIPFIEGMSAKVSYGQTWTHNYKENFFKRYEMVDTKTMGTNGHIWSTKDEDITRTYLCSWPEKSLLEKESTWNGDKQLNFQLNYDRTFSKHHVTAAFVTEWTESFGAGVYGGRENFPVYTTDQFWAASSTREDTYGGGDTTWESGRMSYVGQFTYSYADKYLMSFSFREDGSMNFAPNKRWGFFPAGSLGWVISEEDFFNKSFVDFLKLRLSLGLTGNDSVGGWQWQYSYAQGNSDYWGTDPTRYVGIKYGSVVNPDLTWEKSLSWNLGVDTHLGKNWNASVDYWFRNTYDILGDRQTTLPTTFSQSMPKENYGEIHAQGIDLNIGYKGQTKDFNYYANMTMSYGWNEVIKKDYAENAKEIDIPIGRATNYITGYVYDGIIRTQEQLDEFNKMYPNYTINGKKPELGMMIYKDVSGPDKTPDGIIDSWDKVILHDNNFPIVYGINLGGSWKGLSLDVMFSGRLGEYKSFKDLQEDAEWHRMWHEWYDNSWTEDNPDAMLPKRLPYSEYKTYSEDSEFWLVKNNFLRLKYATLSYSLPKSLLSSVFGNLFQDIKLYCTGTNLFVWSKFKYYDPEIGSGKQFPISRSFNIGVNVKF